MNICNFIVKMLSTFFYLGYLPLSGTFGSMVGVLIFYLIKGNNFIYTLVTLSVISLGLLLTGRAEKIYNKKDPSYVVIDEIAGMLLSLVGITWDIRVIMSAFLVFRILDAMKPYPVGRFQELKGSIGIMGDDIIAGIYTNVILQCVLRILLK